MPFQIPESVNMSSVEIERSGLELRFSSRWVSSPVSTGKPIKAAQGETELEIALYDSRTGEIIKNGPLASARVELVLLPEKFPRRDGADWTALEFQNSIVTEWKHKKNLLQGDVSFSLRHGKRTLGRVWVKHDRIYLGIAKFCLGAMVVDSNFDGVRVKEAITNPFQVKDRRNELTSKNIRPLRRIDKVWRLKNIGKSGKRRERLEAMKIMTVGDFCDQLSSDPERLQEIYGKKDKKWDTTVQHAQECIIEKKTENAGESIEFSSQKGDDAYYVDPLKPNGSRDGNMGLFSQYQHGSTSSLWEDDPDLIHDQTFSIQDIGYESPDTYLQLLHQNENQFQENLQRQVRGGKAHKRWSKFRLVWSMSRYLVRKKIGGATAIIHL